MKRLFEKLLVEYPWIRVALPFVVIAFLLIAMNNLFDGNARKPEPTFLEQVTDKVDQAAGTVLPPLERAGNLAGKAIGRTADYVEEKLDRLQKNPDNASE